MAVVDSGNASLDVAALATHSQVDVIHQHIGGAASFGAAFTYDDSGTSYTDVTTAFGATGTDTTIFDEDNDLVLIGATAKFDEIEVILDTGSNPSIKQGSADIYHYVEDDGDWVAFTPADDTDAFGNSGLIRFDSDDLASWGQRTINEITGAGAATDYYWIKITRTRNNIVTLPVEDTIKYIIATEYYWNKDAELFTNDHDINDDTPHLRLTDTDANQDDYEIYADENQLYITNVTDEKVFINVDDHEGLIEFFDKYQFPDDTPADNEVLKHDAALGRLAWESSAAGYTNLTEFVDQTAWRVFYSDASGDVTELALGDDGEVLTSTGTTSAPDFEAGGGSDTLDDVTGRGADTLNEVTVGDLNQNNATPHHTFRDTTDDVAYQWHLDTDDPNWPNYTLWRGTDADGQSFLVDPHYPLLRFDNNNDLHFYLGGLSLLEDENVTLGDETLDHDGTDFVFSDSLKTEGLGSSGQSEVDSGIVFNNGQGANGDDDDTEANSDTYAPFLLVDASADKGSVGVGTTLIQEWNVNGDQSINDDTPNLEFRDSDDDVAYMWHLDTGDANYPGFTLWKGTEDTTGFLADVDTPLVQFDSDGAANFRQDLKHEFSRSAVIENVSSGDDNMMLGAWTNDITITKIGCAYIGTGTTVATFALEDGGGTAMTHTQPVCEASGTDMTFQPVTAGNLLNAGELLRFDVTNTPDPLTDDYTIVIGWTE